MNLSKNNSLIIGIHGGGGTGDSFKEAIGHHLDNLGYGYVFPNFNGNKSQEKIFESLKNKDYNDYLYDLEKEINYGIQNEYTNIIFLTHSWGASIAFNYMLRKKLIPPQLKKIICMAPVISYLGLGKFISFPKFIQKNCVKLAGFLYRLSNTSGLKEKSINISGMNKVNISTICSYIHHAVLVNSININLPVNIDICFPKNDNVLDGKTKNNLEYHKKILLRNDNPNITFKTYDDDTHNGWFNKFDEIFPQGLF